MQFSRIAVALFAVTVLAAPAASPVDVDDSLTTTTVMLDIPTGAAGLVPQAAPVCCCKFTQTKMKCACGKAFCK
jgi:hypothetical protein